MKSGRDRSRSPRQSGEDNSWGLDDDELMMVGIPDDSDLAQLFDATGGSHVTNTLFLIFFFFKFCKTIDLLNKVSSGLNLTK